jgi:hypothetical protein
MPLDVAGKTQLALSGSDFRPLTVCHTLLQKATFHQVKQVEKSFEKRRFATLENA